MTAEPEYPNPAPPAPAPAPTAKPKPRPKLYDAYEGETYSEYYARKTMKAVHFIAWIIGIFTLAGVILGIVAAVQLSHLNGNLGGGASSNCFSQGGTNLSC